MKQTELLYRGKAKAVYKTTESQYLILDFLDDTSAFDGKKIEQLQGKGAVNNKFNAFIMQHLESNGIKTHFEKILDDNHSLVKKLQMIPLECVIRNIATGSICKRLGVENGLELSKPTYELFLKNDDLGDPLVNEFHALAFGWATQIQMQTMQEMTFQVNTVLQQLFANAGMILVDYKLEFGVVVAGSDQGAIFLGDEFTPDGCRIWDAQTKEKLDKDRFRNNLGNVIESYQIAAKRLGIE